MIYILDSEAEYIKNVEKAGVDVKVGYLGYSQSNALHISLNYPPNEVAAFVYNLTNPACYDGTKCGPGQNSNSHCKIVENPTDDFFYVQSGTIKKRHHKFRQVSRTQISGITSNSKFNTSDVLKSISVAGSPLIVFLNPEHVKHAAYSFLDFLNFGVEKRIEPSITEANKFFIPDNLLESYEGLKRINQDGLSFKKPLNVKIDSFPSSNGGKQTIKIITNSTDETFCLFIPYGKGCVFLSPPFEDPVAGTKVLLEVVFEMLKIYNANYDKMNTAIANVEKNVMQRNLSEDRIRMSYVNQSRIQEIKALSSKKWDLSKLVKICEEINFAYANQCFFMVGMAFRAIIDHIPPIFGQKNFQEVANNYSLSKSEKETFESMQIAYRKIADSFLHTQIRDKEIIPNEQQVHFSPQLDILLSKLIAIISKESQP